MKKVYENLSYHLVGHFKSLLEAEGIACSVRNLGGSGLMGEVPFTEVYPELWVTEDADEARALAILARQREAMEEPAPGPDWTCPSCGEAVPPQFMECWNCGVGHPEEAES